jgi:hypothetical protein
LRTAHGITKTGNKIPINPMDKHVKPRDDDKAIPVREAKYTINLVTTVHKTPFTNALIYLTVIA